MASRAGQISRDLFCFDFRSFFAAACSPVGVIGGGALAGEDLTARAVASAGLAALLALPVLLLSSLVLAAPLAVPAAIGLGYLAASHALAAHHRRRAALINAVVLCGLVGWLLLFLLLGEGALSRAGLTAALMAPLFAAAPAFARSAIATRTVSACDDGSIAMRLEQRTPEIEATPIAVKEPAALRLVGTKFAKPAAAPSCDIGEAVAFALRHATPKAAAKKIRLTCEAEAGIAAVCDRQVGRRILHLLVDNALNGSQAGGTVRVLARRLKGVVLVRATSAAGVDSSDAGEISDDRIDVATLRALIEGVGGTLVVDRRGGEIVLSVRLQLAAQRMMQGKVESRAQGA